MSNSHLDDELETTISQQANEILELRAMVNWLRDADMICMLLGSVYFHGNFKPETPNESYIEDMMRRNGYFCETEDEVIDLLTKEESTPKQSLAAHDLEIMDKVIEECAIIGATEAEACRMPDGQRVADAIRNLKSGGE